MPMNNLRQAHAAGRGVVHRADAGDRAGSGLPARADRPRRRHRRPRSSTRCPGVPWEMKEMVTGTVLPDLQRRGGHHRGHREPHAAHLGRVGVGPRRDAGATHRRARRGRRRDHRVPGLGHGGPEGPHHRQGRRRDRRGAADPRRRGAGRPRRCSGRSCSAWTTTRWSRSCSACWRDREVDASGVAESLTGGHDRLAALRRTGCLARSSAAAWSPTPRDVKHDLLGVPDGPVVTEAAAIAMAHGAQRGARHRRRHRRDRGRRSGAAGGAQPPGTVCMAVAIGDPRARRRRRRRWRSGCRAAGARSGSSASSPCWRCCAGGCSSWTRSRLSVTSDLFGAAAEDRLARRGPLADRLRPHDPRRGRRPGPPARAGQAAAGARRCRPAQLGDPLGSARDRARPPSPGSSREASSKAFVPLSAVTATVKDIREVAARGPAPTGRAGAGHDPVPGRDPPLHQGPAGRAAAVGRDRAAGADRCHHGEPVLRGQPAAAQPLDAVPPAAGSDPTALRSLADAGLAAEAAHRGRRTPSSTWSTGPAATVGTC